MTVASVSELPLVGGHPALDLVNTVEPRLPAAGRHEHLARPADLLTWAERAAMVTGAEAGSVAAAWAAEPGTAVLALNSVIRIREALACTLDAILQSGQPEPDGTGGSWHADQGAAPGEALDYLSLRWGAAMARSRLVPAGRGARLAVGSAAAELIADRAVAAAVSLLCDSDVHRLGICPPGEHGCGWLFLDRSKNGSRRWCAMDCCGAHAKAKRLTERRRTMRAHRNPE